MGKKVSLEQIINQLQKDNSFSISHNIPLKYLDYVNDIGNNCNDKKGLYTVFTTLLYYKYLHPEQDIRLHQDRFPKGFSGRSFDTKYVTPILNKCNLPAMAESGWLTRSLEQPYPYDLKYNGSLGTLKVPFLETLDYVQKHPKSAYDLLNLLLLRVIQVEKENRISIIPLSNPENLTIETIINALYEHFSTHYGTHNGAKLPVLAFHSIYSCLINELKRYKDCSLADLSSLTACDRTNKTSGDIEIFKNENVFESVEIKLDIKISAQVIRNVEKKIYKYNPQRYYVLSVYGIEKDEEDEINTIVLKVLNEHGCQIIINGLIPTIKYYLRLIANLSDFVLRYSNAIEIDNELQAIHKQKWNDIIQKYNL